MGYTSELEFEVVRDAPPPPNPTGNRRGRPADITLLDLLLKMRPGDCVDVNRTCQSVINAAHRVRKQFDIPHFRVAARKLRAGWTRIWRLQ